MVASSHIARAAVSLPASRLQTFVPGPTDLPAFGYHRPRARCGPAAATISSLRRPPTRGSRGPLAEAAWQRLVHSHEIDCVTRIGIQVRLIPQRDQSSRRRPTRRAGRQRFECRTRGALNAGRPGRAGPGRTVDVRAGAHVGPAVGTRRRQPAGRRRWRTASCSPGTHPPPSRAAPETPSGRSTAGRTTSSVSGTSTNPRTTPLASSAHRCDSIRIQPARTTLADILQAGRRPARQRRERWERGWRIRTEGESTGEAAPGVDAPRPHRHDGHGRHAPRRRQ